MALICIVDVTTVI